MVKVCIITCLWRSFILRNDGIDASFLFVCTVKLVKSYRHHNNEDGFWNPLLAEIEKNSECVKSGDAIVALLELLDNHRILFF